MKTGNFATTFDKVRKADLAAKLLMWISAVLMLAEMFTQKLQYATATYYVVAVNCFVLVIFQIASFSRELLQFKAEMQKRLDLFDNSFGTKLSETHSDGYYSNDDVTPGYLKLAVNNFESVFFTHRIMKADLFCIVAKAIIICALFVFVAILGLQNIFVILIQITLPITILVESIRYAVTEYRIEGIYLEYRKLFEKKDSIRDADILNQLVNYTATLTAGSVLLSNKTYNRLNVSLSKEWEEIKKEFEIQQTCRYYHI